MSDPLIIVAIIGLAATPIGVFVTWFLNRNKDKIDRTANLILASGEAVDAIRDVMNTLQDDLERTKENLNELRDQNEQLIVANKQLVGAIEDLKDHIKAAIRDQKHPKDFWELLSKIPGVRDVE